MCCTLQWHSSQIHAGCPAIGPRAGPENAGLASYPWQSLRVCAQGAKKQQILDLIQQLESHTPVSAPVQDLGMCHGRWRLLFSTITITVSCMGAVPVRNMQHGRHAGILLYLTYTACAHMHGSQTCHSF